MPHSRELRRPDTYHIHINYNYKVTQMSIYIDIEKNLGNFHLKVKLEAGDEVLALLGASGCGKSMTLKCIAGIERPDRGRIVVDGVTLFDSERRINLTPQERHTGLMFQNYALFPNMTVRQNIYAGTRRERKKGRGNDNGRYTGKSAGIKLTREQADINVEEMMKRFGLEDLADHLPSQLSGGQQQRTALARLLVSSPQILMLDEPFSALDTFLRLKMEQEVGTEIRRFGKTVILVSHDRDEVFRMADKIAVIHDGRVESFGTKEEVFRNPCTRNGATLTGCRNISAIEKLSERELFARDWGIRLRTNEDILNKKFVGLRNNIGYRLDAVSMSGGQNADTLKMAGRTSAEMAGVPAETVSEMINEEIVCDIVGVVENPASYMIRLWPEKKAEDPDAAGEMNARATEKSYSEDSSVDQGILIEIPKTECGSIPQGKVVISISDDAVMLLEE